MQKIAGVIPVPLSQRAKWKRNFKRGLSHRSSIGNTVDTVSSPCIHFTRRREKFFSRSSTLFRRNNVPAVLRRIIWRHRCTPWKRFQVIQVIRYGESFINAPLLSPPPLLLLLFWNPMKFSRYFLESTACNFLRIIYTKSWVFNYVVLFWRKFEESSARRKNGTRWNSVYSE